jgi:hypothetical protein
METSEFTEIQQIFAHPSTGKVMLTVFWESREAIL